MYIRLFKLNRNTKLMQNVYATLLSSSSDLPHNTIKIQ